jgi:hypothetical protein
VSRFPVAFRPPAFASRSSCSRRGVGPSSRSAYRARLPARTPTGLPRSTRMSCDRGGCPLYPEDGGAPRPSRLLDRRLPLCHGQSLLPAGTSHQAGHCFTRHQRGFTRFTRPVFPSPVAARMERAALGLSPGLRTPPTKSRRRTPRWGQANEHRPGTTRSTSHQSILQSVVHSQRATSRRTTSCRRPAARDGRTCRSCIRGNAVATGFMRPGSASAAAGECSFEEHGADRSARRATALAAKARGSLR